MTITRLQRVVVDALEDIKAQDIRVYDTAAMTELFDRVVVASATSNRQTRALAAHVRDTARQKGYQVVSTEGEDTGEWVLVDLGDLVVHIMQPAIRQYYNLEELWGAKPVRMRIGFVATPSAPPPGSDPRPAARSSAKPAARPPARPAARPPARPAARPPAKSAARPPAKSAAGSTAKSAARSRAPSAPAPAAPAPAKAATRRAGGPAKPRRLRSAG